ncbi:hypothetical protein CDD83_7311 [Cordyceps sp. RAO-2017]|nr:hypothetical protein CDD83_7311 [Cordyceps sp. RAO-2017]
MPTPWHPLPSVLPPLYIYRHLLRETSYLPPAFRKFIAATVRERFRRHQTKDPRAKEHISRAKSGLRTLRAANSGDAKAMTSLIDKAFGRLGIRRRQLISQFVKLEGPANSEELESQLDKARAELTATTTSPAPTMTGREVAKQPRKQKYGFLEKWDQKKMLQLLRSQKEQQANTKQTASWPLAEVKGLDQDQFTPKENIWGRPPANVLVRAKRARWWKLAAEKMMPPLLRGEWELLGRLSRGAQDETDWAIPERRRAAQALASHDQDTSAAWDWLAYATKTVDMVEKPKALANQRRSGQRDTGPHAWRERKPTLSARWFRRAYNRTWQLTPTMHQDANTLRYSVEWGTAPLRLAPATDAQLEFFRGVTERVPRKKKR